MNPVMDAARMLLPLQTRRPASAAKLDRLEHYGAAQAVADAGMSMSMKHVDD
jgi:hypothetical protein